MVVNQESGTQLALKQTCESVNGSNSSHVMFFQHPGHTHHVNRRDANEIFIIYSYLSYLRY